jgi:F-type H+-transporting ATPase subunit beta
MDSTDGLSRGYEVVGTGYPIQMPIGADVYGRLFNVIGDAIDGLETYQKQEKKCQFTVKLQIRRSINNSEVLFTGIKVIDLIEPYSKG